MKKTLTRDELRAQLFKQHKPKTALVEIYGAIVELHQPTIGEVLDIKDQNDPKKAMMLVLTKYCCVPGTDEIVFEDTDVDMIMKWPMDTWFTNLHAAFEKLTDISLPDKEKNLGATSTGSSSSPSPSA